MKLPPVTTGMKSPDVIVVGGGLAGLTAAKVLAERGVSVVVFERGEAPGTKSLMGGVVYRKEFERVFPNFGDEAPVERRVVREGFFFHDGHSGYAEVSVKHPEPSSAYTVLRRKFDPWLWEEAKKAGAILIPKVLVKSVLVENGCVVGVETDRPPHKLSSRLVLLCEGSNSRLADSLGIYPRKRTVEDYALVAKEVFYLGSEEIDKRFGLERGEGFTAEFYGELVRDSLSLGFFYTNEDTVSVGIGVVLDCLAENGTSIYDALDYFKSLPPLSRWLRGAKVVEYGARLIPESGSSMLPRLWLKGLMVGGDAAFMVNSPFREGSNLAVLAGRLMGECGAEYVKSGDEKWLADYERRYRASFAYDDVRTFSRFIPYFKKNLWAVTDLPREAVGLLSDFLERDSVPKRRKAKELFRRLRSQFSLVKLGRLFFDVWRLTR